MEQLSKTQQEVFNYIKREIDLRGMAPSVREIGNAVGLKSTSSVQYQLEALESKGYIVREPNLKRTIRIAGSAPKPSYVPLLGMVTAGAPILAQQCIEDYIPVPARAGGKELFALKVRGESMLNAGILDGDIVIVEQTPVAENGDIVVALIENEATVKRFYKENGHFRLQPENDSFEPIIVSELAILGRVKMMIRNYE